MLLQRTNHKNIVKCFEVFGFEGHQIAVLENLKTLDRAMELVDIYNKNGLQINKTQILTNIVLDVLRGMTYLQNTFNLQFINILPKHIMFEETTKGKFTAKIINFTSGFDVLNGKTQQNPKYAAPELQNN